MMPEDEPKQITQFKMKKSAAQEARERFRNLMSYDYMDYNTMMETITSFFLDDDVARSWIELIEKKTFYGEPFTVEEVIDFKSEAHQQYIRKFGTLDGMSRLLEMGGGDENGHKINWNMRFPDCLVSNFKLNGTYGVVHGHPRSGKTSLATELMRLMGERFNMQCITNIKIKDAPDYINYVTKLSDALRLMVDLNKWILVLDETATFVPRRRAQSSRNLGFENLARFVGKLSGRLIMVTHSMRRDLPTILQDWTSEIFYKRDLKEVMVHLSKVDGYMKLHRKIVGVPDTKLNFITEDIAGIKFDVDIDKLLQHIPDAMGEKQNEAIIEFLEEPEKAKQKIEDIIQKWTEKILKDPELQEQCRGESGKVTGVAIYGATPAEVSQAKAKTIRDRVKKSLGE